MRRKIKWFFTIVAIAAFYILGTAFPDDDLGGRAMAVGLGVDMDDSGNIVASAQILTSANTQDSTAGTRVIGAKSKTLSGALSKISEDCGLTLTVTHCNVVVIGEKLAKSERFFNQLVVLFENTYVSDNAFMFVCEGTPKELFDTKSGFGNNASQYLQRLAAQYGTFDNIAFKMLRQVFIDTYDVGRTTWVPYLKKNKIAALVPPSSSYESSTEEEDYVYSMKDVAVFVGTKFVGVYGENQSRALNFMMYQIEKGGEEFDISIGTVGLYILKSDTKTDYDFEKKTVNAKIEVKATVKDIVYDDKAANYDETLTYHLNAEQKKECQKLIEDNIIDFYKEMSGYQADVYKVKQMFYAEYGKKAKNLKLDDIKFNVKVSIKLED